MREMQLFILFSNWEWIYSLRYFYNPVRDLRFFTGDLRKLGVGVNIGVMPILGMKAPFVRNFRGNFILQYFLYTNTRNLKNVLSGVFRGFGEALGCLEKLTLGGLL